MKILVHDHSGHPFSVQLSRSLSKRGYTVTHIYSASFQSPKGTMEIAEEDSENFSIKGIKLSKPFAKYSYWKRRRQEIEYARLLVKEVADLNPDVVISGNTPLDAQEILLKHCQKNDIRFVFWVQDFYGLAIQNILRKKLSFLGYSIGRYYEKMEQKQLLQSNAVVLISEDFKPIVDGYGIEDNRISVIENWAPLNEIPYQSKSNPWSQEHGLEEFFCLLYSGTLGKKHNPELLLNLALAFRDDPKVKVVVVSEGIGANWLAEKCKENALENLKLLPFQPFEQFPNVLASADLLLAFLEPEAGSFSVPSKILSYLCAGRSILISVPEENLSARIVKNSESGIVVPPDEIDNWTQAAKELIQNCDQRIAHGKNARAYAEETFNIDCITEKFEKTLVELQ